MTNGQTPDLNNLVPPDLAVRYKDFGLIGAGGMGRVISAHDTHLNRPVAIKMLPRTGGQALAVMRFQQEAKSVSKLNNPHIVQVLDFGFAETGEPYLVMEHVKGETLDALIEKRGPLPVLDALNIAVQLCSALEHAHKNEVVHRDLKPGNIMVLADNQVRVLDFGLARILNMPETDWRLTRPGQPMGSLLYMSPEQVKGEDADERSDVYSLGLVILKMVAGKLPFEEKKVLEIVQARLSEEPPVIPQIVGQETLCTALNEVVQRALSVDVENRFSSMTEFKNALIHVPADADQIAALQAAATAVQTPKSKGSNRLMLALPAALLLLIAGAVFLFSKNSSGKVAEVATMQKAQSVKQLLGEKIKHVDSEGGFWKGSAFVEDSDLALLEQQPFPISDLRFDTNDFITEKGIESLTKLPLTRLVLRHTAHIGDDSIRHINKMTKLTYLDLQGSQVTDQGLLKLSKDLPITRIDLKSLPNVTEVGIKQVIDTYPNLEFLSISSTGMKREALPLVTKLQKLRILRISALGLVDNDLDCLIPMKSIAGLECGDNPLTNAAIDKLLQMNSLKSINIDYCRHMDKDAWNRLRRPGRTVSAKQIVVLDDEEKGFLKKLNNATGN